MKYAVGVDVGGTNTRVALLDEDLNLISREQFATDTEDPETTLQQIAAVVESFDRDIAGIGMSCPGPLDLIHGTVLAAPNLGEAWRGYDLTGRLEELTGVQTTLENDANLACLAEAELGEGKGLHCVNFMTISTGVGSGQAIDGKIVQGSHGFAHEIANVILWRDGPSQGQLKNGACEAICSGTAITRRAKAAGLNVRHAGEVNDLALQGNEAAAEIMEDAREYLANMIAAVYAINDPDIMILGGSVAMKIPGFADDLEKRVKEKVYAPLQPYVKIRKSTLSEDSGLIGAGVLAFSKAAEAAGAAGQGSF